MIDGLLSIIFFGIELAILIVVIVRNRDHPFFWTIVSLIALLQLYQLSEFFICIGLNGIIVGKMAFIIITFLPPTGYLLATQIVKWKYKDYIIGFALGLAISIYYLIIAEPVTLVNCNPLYATYEYAISNLYGIYYFGLLSYAIIFLLVHMLFKWRKNIPIDNKSSIILILGYLCFMIPMNLMVLIERSFGVSTPSIMCKYAISFAIILGIYSFIKPKDLTEKFEEKKDGSV